MKFKDIKKGDVFRAKEGCGELITVGRKYKITFTGFLEQSLTVYAIMNNGDTVHFDRYLWEYYFYPDKVNKGVLLWVMKTW